MDEATRALIDVSCALSSGSTGRLEAALRAAAAVAGPDAIEEALLQSYLFLGYPAALRGVQAWRRVSGRPAPQAPSGDEAEWEERGIETCARVYAGQYERLRANIAALHPDLERWMVVEGYGKVLGRPGLDLATRELCIVALLAAQDAAPQLYSHLRGALNAGAAEAIVEEAVRRMMGALPPDRARTLTEQWHAVRARRNGSSQQA